MSATARHDRAACRPRGPRPATPCVDDPALRSSAPSTVTLTAPQTAGTNLVYRVTYTKAPSERRQRRARSRRSPCRSWRTRRRSSTCRGDTTVEGEHDRRLDRRPFTATATDAEDDPDPAVDCTPARRRPAGARHDDHRVRGDRHRRAPRADRLVPRHRRGHDAARRSGACRRRRRDHGRIRVAPRSPTRRRPRPTSSTRRPPSAACRPRARPFAVGTTTVTCTATERCRQQRERPRSRWSWRYDAADADADARPPAHADAATDAHRATPTPDDPPPPRRRRTADPDAAPATHADHGPTPSPHADPVAEPTPVGPAVDADPRRAPRRRRPGWRVRGTGPSATAGRWPASAGRCRPRPSVRVAGDAPRAGRRAARADPPRRSRRAPCRRERRRSPDRSTSAPCAWHERPVAAARPHGLAGRRVLAPGRRRQRRRRRQRGRPLRRRASLRPARSRRVRSPTA